MIEAETQAQVIEAQDISGLREAIIIDCRFQLGDASAGREAWRSGHIPGAFYLDLESDLSAPARKQGGRHPLPEPQAFADTLAGLGVHRGSKVVAYDDSGFAFAARLWWMMRSLGYRPPQLLNGGYSAWLEAGGRPDTFEPVPDPCESALIGKFHHCVDIEALRDAQARGAWLMDVRESRRYEGLEEPIDPVAGHIPGALNRPWQAFTDERGLLLDSDSLRDYLGELLDAREVVVYCGSGVTACVGLFALSAAGREDALLYPGSWSDWCSYLST